MAKRFTPVLTLIAICWLVFIVNNLLWNVHLIRYGIVPRHISGLPGILWAPFMHASFSHLMANTLPLLILGGMLCARNPGEFIVATFAGIVVGGGLTWLFARTANHIGASGLIFCYFGYLASLAWFERSAGTFLLSLACIVFYGGLIKGIFPTSAAVSWEGHLAGLIAGVSTAWLVGKVKRTPSDAPPAAVTAGR